MSQAMIPYPFMNLLEHEEIGRQRYGEVKNDGGRDWIQKALSCREQIRGMEKAEQSFRVQQFLDQMQTAYLRGKLSPSERDEVKDILRGV